ncbi:MAG: response regulator [bacterium]|nr:response regulator [bacterium]
MVRPVALVVDDDRGVRDAMRRFLTAERLECAVARDGISGLRLAMSTSPIAAFIDIHLPTMDGISVLRRIREVRPYMKVVMMSAAANEEEIGAIFDLGAYRFLAKPRDLYNLEEIIYEVLYGNLPDIPVTKQIAEYVRIEGHIQIVEKDKSN